jgi:cell division inhibitor SulA
MFDPLQIPNVFRARSVSASVRKRVPTGFIELDTALSGGWPHPALIEILVDVYGIGELQLMLPLWRTLICADHSLIVWLNPPHTPNGVAFKQSHLHACHWLANNLNERDVLWAAEQCLRSNAIAAVLAWTAAPTMAGLRRLKLAAASTASVAIVFRRLRDAAQPSPATIRLALRPQGERLQVDVLKYEGRKPSTVLLDVHARTQWSSVS